MEAFTLFLWEGGVIVVLEERKHPSEILLSKLDNFFLDLVHVDSVFGQVLPHNFQAPLASPTHRLRTIHILGTQFIQAVIGQVHICVLQVLVSRLFVILSAKSSQSLLVQKTYVRLD